MAVGRSAECVCVGRGLGVGGLGVGGLGVGGLGGWVRWVGVGGVWCPSSVG